MSSQKGGKSTVVGCDPTGPRAQFQVERGVPVLEYPRGRPAKYPFRSMKVGDSFLVPETGLYAANRVSRSASACGSRNGCKYVTRRVPEGVRCWRVK